jgi:DNA primase
MRVDVSVMLEGLGIKSRRRGGERWACCPFHAERDASWQIRDDPGNKANGLWRCFGCGARGNPVQLVAAVLDTDTDAAIAWMEETGCIAGEPALPVRVTITSTRGIEAAFRLPAGVLFEPPAEWVTPARRYVAKRGITEGQIERWGVGYSLYGRLRGRVVFPIRDGGQHVIGYTARSFIGDPKRYLEPHTKEGATSGAVFGEEHWPAHGERGAVVLTEGAINALAIERVIEDNPEFDGHEVAIAAVRGSHFLPGHAARLATFSRVLVASDPDAAGEKLWRDVRAMLGRWSRVVRVTFPSGVDAADLDPKILAEIIGEAWHDTTR